MVYRHTDRMDTQTSRLLEAQLQKAKPGEQAQCETAALRRAASPDVGNLRYTFPPTPGTDTVVSWRQELLIVMSKYYGPEMLTLKHWACGGPDLAQTNT